MNSINCIALITITLTAFTTVNGLTCYSCNSLSKPYCSDPYDPPDIGALALEYKTNCTSEIEKIVRSETHPGLASHVNRNGTQYVAVCRKVMQKVENVVRVFRSCGWYDASTEQATCTQRTGSLGVTQTQCVCRGDLCNQGIISQQSTSTIALLITVISLVSVNGLECWDCKGHINPGCNDPFNPEVFAKKKCNDHEKVCLKILQKSSDGSSFNARGCGVLDQSLPDTDESMGCRDLSYHSLPTVQECVCRGDGCNGSSQLIALGVTSLLPIIIYSLLIA